MSTAPYRFGPVTGLLASGGLVMLLGSGPTLLAVGLAAELHGTRWVAGSALAFALGSPLAPFAVARLERRAVPPSIAWPALGVGMVGGWTFAAWHPFGLLAAQFLSGMCMSTLEGDMDARIASSNDAPRGVTAGLASAAALRAFGSAAAVALAPPGHRRQWRRGTQYRSGHRARCRHGGHPRLAPEPVGPVREGAAANPG